MDEQELSTLYRRVGPLIYRRCLRLLGDRECAREATQEVFVRAVRHRKSLDLNDRHCLPWLYRVATNYCLNQWRDRTPSIPVDALATLSTARSSDAEERLAAIEKVAALLAPFDERSRQIALYTFLDGMTQDEIAEVMDLSRRTVGTRLREFLAAVSVQTMNEEAS